MPARKYFSRRMIALWLIAIVLGCTMLIHGPSDTLDARFFYSAQEASDYLTGLSSEKAHRYFVNELIDLVFLATYSMISILSLKRGASRFSRAIALSPGFADLAETMTILILLSSDLAAPAILGILTAAKWNLGALNLINLALNLKSRPIKEPT